MHFFFKPHVLLSQSILEFKILFGWRFPQMTFEPLMCLIYLNKHFLLWCIITLWLLPMIYLSLFLPFILIHSRSALLAKEYISLPNCKAKRSPPYVRRHKQLSCNIHVCSQRHVGHLAYLGNIWGSAGVNGSNSINL